MPHSPCPTSKIVLPPFVWMLFLFLLPGCSPTTPAITPTPQVKAIPTRTAVSLPTASPIPTIPVTETSLPSGSPSVEPTRAVVTVPGLRMAYAMGGNLYVQDSGGQPLQLTRGGTDLKPELSDDGQKLVFLRAKHPGDEEKTTVPLDLYSINADGSGELRLMDAGQLRVFNSKYGESSEVFSWVFVPGTHHLLFNTHKVNSNGRYADMWTNQDLFMVDTDSGLPQLVFLPGGFPEQVSRFVPSPNGQQLAVQRIVDGHPTGQIDLIDLAAKTARADIFGVMFPDEPSRIMRDYVSVRWVADGSRLLVVPGYPLDLPVVGRSIWQYSMADGSVARIEFTPSPSAFMFDISPDGEWIAYTHFTATDEHDDSYGVYLGNLRSGETRKLGSRENYQANDEYAWSPDNTHFYFSDSVTGSGAIGDIHGNVEPGCHELLFLGWIDNQRYICGRGIMGEVGKTERKWFIDPPRGFVWNYDTEFDFVLLK